MGYYTPHLKIAVLPQCEAFSVDLTGRRSICALRRAKITEGERVVPPIVSLHGRFLCTNLGRRSISKGNMATPLGGILYNDHCDIPTNRGWTI